jgi:hypothetical protein
MKELQNNIKSVVSALKNKGKMRLAGEINKNWQKTSLSYSKELNNWKPVRPIEKELLSAFSKELERLEIKDSKKTDILNSVKKRRVLQTGPHLGVSESPRMLCINWLGSLGVNMKDFYIVAMFSGIPFSNKSRPGRINKKKDSINLFPASMQDAIVYRSIIPEKLIESFSKLPEKIKKLLPNPKLGNSYTKWALMGCQNIESKILNKKNLIFIDINEVVTNYLLEVLKNKKHIFYKIFFDLKTHKEFIKAFPNEIMFYSSALDGKYEKMENVIFSGKILKSKNKEISLENSENLIKELKKGRLCPALITGFLALAFLNEFKCLGSFAQVEYLPVYQKKLAKLKCLKGLNIKKVPTANLTTGVFPENPNLYPIDIILGEKFKPNKRILFGELLLSMKEVLLESYFTGDNRKNEKK